MYGLTPNHRCGQFLPILYTGCKWKDSTSSLVWKYFTFYHMFSNFQKLSKISDTFRVNFDQIDNVSKLNDPGGQKLKKSSGSEGL